LQPQVETVEARPFLSGAAPNRWEVPSSLQRWSFGLNSAVKRPEPLRAMNHGNGNGDVGCRTVGWEDREVVQRGFSLQHYPTP